MQYINHRVTKSVPTVPTCPRSRRVGVRVAQAEVWREIYKVLPGAFTRGAKEPEFHLVAVVKANATVRMQQLLQQAGGIKILESPRMETVASNKFLRAQVTGWGGCKRVS